MEQGKLRRRRRFSYTNLYLFETNHPDIYVYIVIEPIRRHCAKLALEYTNQNVARWQSFLGIFTF